MDSNGFPASECMNVSDQDVSLLLMEDSQDRAFYNNVSMNAVSETLRSENDEVMQSEEEEEEVMISDDDEEEQAGQGRRRERTVTVEDSRSSVAATLDMNDTDNSVGGGFIVNGTLQLDSTAPLEVTIDLSSDEEEAILEQDDDDDDDGGDVEVLVIRPMSKSQLLGPRSEEDVLEISASKNELNLDEKSGYVKEIIEEDGLGMLFSMECGLVLFHLSAVWVDGAKATAADLRPGKSIHFIDCYLEGAEYACVSAERFMRQAAAAWIGERPAHLLKEVKSTQYQADMLRHRGAFLDMVAAHRFLHVPLVRARGEITGYLTREIGLIETEDGEGEGVTKLVAFHVGDLYLFGQEVRTMRESVDRLAPPGLRVIFDAVGRPMHRGVSFQACAVFAGSWPAVPHPTMLPGGPGSTAPCYDVPGRETFYYLNLALPRKLDKMWEAHRRRADLSRELLEARCSVDSRDDYFAWRDTYCPYRFKPRVGGKFGPKRNYHIFKKAPPITSISSKAKEKVIKVEDLEPVIKLELSFAVKEETV